ncbi:MAG: hypothetical protein AB4368_16225, partial [Xenococcaceae cyanobacterium]
MNLKVLAIALIPPRIYGAIADSKTNHGKTMTNINTSVDRIIPNRQVSKAILDPQVHLRTGVKVYLYNDPKYTGTLIHPVERTYPPRWTVELDNGSYEAVTVSDFSPVTTISEQISSEKLPSEERTEIKIRQLEEEILALKQENQRLSGTLTVFTYQKGVKASPDGDLTSTRLNRLKPRYIKNLAILR